MKARHVHFPPILDRGTLGLRRQTNKTQAAVQLFKSFVDRFRGATRFRVRAELDPATFWQPQGPHSGVNAIIGRWPGDETDEQIAAALEELS